MIDTIGTPPHTQPGPLTNTKGVLQLTSQNIITGEDTFL